MTKDWKSQKAEIRRLYIGEGRTLEDVRAILKGRGFSASVRAYRMKLEDWGFRKNESGSSKQMRPSAMKKGKQHVSPCTESLEKEEPRAVGCSSTIVGARVGDGVMMVGDEVLHPQVLEGVEPQLYVRDVEPGIVEPYRVESEYRDVRGWQLKFDWTMSLEENLRPTLYERHGYLLPLKPISVRELLQSLSPLTRTVGPHSLWIVLAKWQLDGSYLEGTLTMLKDCPTAWVSHPEIIKAIEMTVTARERMLLVRACLANLCKAIDWTPASRWQRAFREAVLSETWTSAQSKLKEACEDTKLQSKAFYGCALVVVAERLLARDRDRLEKMSAARKRFPDDKQAKNEANVAFSGYMEVIDSFIDAVPGMDLSVEWYKFAVKLDK